MTPRGAAGLVALASLLLVAEPVSAQSVRISGATTVRYIELRPLLRDSVSVGDTDGDGLLRQTPDGRVVRCIPGESFCQLTRPGSTESTVPMIHDVDVSVWGLGRGVRVFTQLRGRTSLSGDPDLWPRAEDALDVLAAYAEVERPRLKLRAGRQWRVSGLGFYNFDGAALALRPVRAAWVEVYGGRSLVRGLNEARTGGALESVEPLAPPEPGLLFGVNARYRPSERLALSTTYQVDFRDDRRGIYSELAIADGALRVGAAWLEASLETDLARVELNSARFRVRYPPIGSVVLQSEIRRYRPYFELWTIWGAFSPVGFDEARLAATWAKGGALTLRGDASYRRYEPDNADGVTDLRSDGWGLGANASWAFSDQWRVEGAYRVESGFGAARREGSATVVRQLGERGMLALHALAFQRLYEFRLEEGTVIGLGGEASLRLTDRTRAFASATSYRHADAGPNSGFDWNQRRATLRLEWAVGAEPGSVGGER